MDEMKERREPEHADLLSSENDASDKREESREETQENSRYGYYQIKSPASAPEKKGNRNTLQRRARKSFVTRLLETVALAVIFGLVASLFFQTGTYIAEKAKGGSGVNRSLSVEEAEETLEESPAVPAAVPAAEYTDSGKGAVAEVAKECMPSVVAITTVSVQEIVSFFGYGTRRYESEGSGSGIIVGENDEELLIATNNHVVSGASTLSVCFMDAGAGTGDSEVSGSSGLNLEGAVNASVKGTDTKNDLAVIAVNKADIPQDTLNTIRIATLGDSGTLVVGEQVVAIGNALGYGQSVTSGWISALDRTVSTQEGNSSSLIQTDAAINPGNSGGALLNMDGELIGINSAKYADSRVEGMGYAIPISRALPILEDLMNRPTRQKLSPEDTGYLGVSVADISVEASLMYSMPSGAFVAEAFAGEPADLAGLRRGDIITKLDGQTVSDREELIERLQYYEAGEEVEIEFARAEYGRYELQVLNVKLGERPAGT